MRHQSVSEAGCTLWALMYYSWIRHDPPLPQRTQLRMLDPDMGGGQDGHRMCLDGILMSLPGDDTTLTVCLLQKTLSRSCVVVFLHRKGWAAELEQGHVG